MNKDIKKVLYSEDEIKNVITIMGNKINSDYKEGSPLVIGILNGVAPFMVNLINRIDIPINIDFIKVKSYAGTESTGDVKIIGHVPDVSGRDIILCDDILDTGFTISEIKKLFLNNGAKSIKIAVLLNKIGRRKVDIEADYKGFDIPNEFVVGFGLDYNEYYRNLPYIGVLKEEVYSNKE